jgi:3-hydroxymyristoyl/3-hydroxydecanoyl-(acyl carrier protein) dehydratase
MEPAPTLKSVKYLTGNESFFSGHFPKISIMPGAMTFEGLGQSVNITSVIMALRDLYKKEHRNPDEVCDDLQNLEYAFTLNPAYKKKKTEFLKQLMEMHTENLYGLVGFVNLKFLEPISAGNLVEYEVIRTGTLDNYMHYDIFATVDGRVKAKGKMSSIHGFGVLNDSYFAR